MTRDMQDHAGRTALHFAARFKNDKAIDALLMNGADIHITDKCGQTAFTYCLESRQPQEKDCHVAAMNHFFDHMKKMYYLNLDPSTVNECSFRLIDMLSETGLVAAYPNMGYDRRLVIDTFFKNVDVYLREYSETIGFLILQYRKAVKRISLISPAAKSLKVSVGFAFP